MLSVIIPARNEEFLEKTIRDVLANARGEIEVLVVLDGWLPEPRIDIGDERVQFFHFEESIGQRAAINYAAERAKGKYIMKLDAHCAMDEGFDVKLAADCKYEWTVVPRMYNLNTVTWKPRFFDDFEKCVRRRKGHDYLQMAVNEKDELRVNYYPHTVNAELHKNTDAIVDNMCCIGCCFFMHKDRFWELEGCDPSHYGWGQQGVEVSCKAWLSGGALKTNKNTWFAHWFRGGGGPGFPYTLSGPALDKTRKYSTDLWMNNKWSKQVRSFEWLVQKFNPPGWSMEPDLSVVIPSWKDPMLHKTVQDILDNFSGSFEVIPVIDGYTLKEPLPEDPRVRPVFHDTNKGMREAINSGVAAARGKYLMRADEHCCFAPGFDRTMLEALQSNWILTARRYHLDPIEWRRMDELGYIDYEKLIVKNIGGKFPKFSGVSWPTRRRERHDVMVDETMAMQGSCWMMTREWWDSVIGRLQTEGYGPLYQDSTEMLFKTWNAGGKLMVSKHTWFAHRYKRFNRTHYYPSTKAAPEWKYALDKWHGDYERIREQWGV